MEYMDNAMQNLMTSEIERNRELPMTPHELITDASPEQLREALRDICRYGTQKWSRACRMEL